MTKNQFEQALLWAKSKQPAKEDVSLMGCGLADYQPTWTTIEGVAELLRWQARYLMQWVKPGQVLTEEDWWDKEAIQEVWRIARYKFLVPDTDRIAGQVLAQALEGKHQ